MADAGQRPGRTSTAGGVYEINDRSGWTAWVIFAGVIMIMIGLFHAVCGVVALFQDEYYLARPSGLVVSVDYTAWGWTHIVVGTLIFAAGCGALIGQVWARVIGVILAVISAFANVLFIAAYPLWSVLIITLDVIVIYALIVYGHELKDD